MTKKTLSFITLIQLKKSSLDFDKACFYQNQSRLNNYIYLQINERNKECSKWQDKIQKHSLKIFIVNVCNGRKETKNNRFFILKVQNGLIENTD